MNPQKINILKVAAFFLALVSVIARVLSLPYSNQDMVVFNLVWYDTLYRGIASALATNFSNYTPPYTYLLALMTFTRGWISPLTAIKLIPTCFDVLNAFMVYKIVRLKFPQGDLPYLAAAVLFAAPTILVNSSYWGQVDALYTSWLLICIYLLLIEKPLPALLAFGMSFSFKAQAVFLVPFLFILVLRKKIHWLYFGFIPFVYLVVTAPVVLLGRPLSETLLIYVTQSNTFNNPAMNAPNLYFFLPREWITVIVPLGALIAALAVLYWSLATSKSRIELNRENMLLLAFLSVALMPYLLPKMHDRYFYPADVFSILLAFYVPSLWFLPIAYQIISFTAVSSFLFNTDPAAIGMAALLNSIVLAVILKKQDGIAALDWLRPVNFSLLSWSVAILTPLVVFGLSLSFILSPLILRAAYIVSPAPLGLNRSERFRWASESVNYLSNDKKPLYLSKLRLDNDKPVFNASEIALLDSTKQTAQAIFNVIKTALLGVFVLSLLAWINDQLPALRRGVQWGGVASIGLGIIFALLGIFTGGTFRAALQGTDMLARLFPIQLWMVACEAIFVFMAAGGFLLTKTNKMNGG